MHTITWVLRSQAKDVGIHPDYQIEETGKLPTPLYVIEARSMSTCEWYRVYPVSTFTLEEAMQKIYSCIADSKRWQSDFRARQVE